jgi:hypothetical protein
MPVVLAETCRIWILSKVASALRMVIGPKYNGKYLHALLRQYLGDLRLEMMLTNVVIPAAEVHHYAFSIGTIKTGRFSRFFCSPKIEWFSQKMRTGFFDSSKISQL